MAMVFVGIGLANNLFALHGWVESGKTTLVCPVPSDQTLEAVADLPSLNIILEISSGISPRRAFEDTSHKSDRQQVNSGLLLSGIPSNGIPRRTNGALLSGSYLSQRHDKAHKAVCRWAVFS